MNFAEMLIYADIEQLNRIAKHYHCDCNYHSKNELIQSILSSVHSQSLDELIERDLSEEIFRFLQLLTFDHREQYSKEELLAKAKQSLASSSDMTERMIFTEGVKNKYMYTIPNDLKTNWMKRIGTYYKDKNFNVQLPPRSYRDEGTTIIDDLIIFLQFVKQEIIQLTGDGSIYKRQQLQLFDKFRTVESPIDKGGWRFGFGYRYPQYPDRFSLLYDYAIHNRLISEENDGLLILQDAGHHKLQTYIPLFEGRELYRFWLRLYRRPIPYLPYVVRLLYAAVGSNWVPSHDCKKIVLPWLKEYYYESIESLFESKIIQMLLYMGLIKVGNNNEMEMITFTNNGQQWIQGVQGEVKEIDFSEYKQVRVNESRI